MRRWTAASAAVVLLAGLLAGCFDLQREPPERTRWLLEAPRTASETEAEAASGRGVLEVRPFGVAPAFATEAFVHRYEGGEHAEDFYHEFFVPPGLMISSSVVQWLRAGGAFDAVQQDDGEVLPDLVLEGDVTELYADLAGEQPQAVLGVKVFVVDPREHRLLLGRTYRRQVPVSDRSPRSLVSGWNEALGTVLRRLEEDLLEVLRSRRKLIPEGG